MLTTLHPTLGEIVSSVVAHLAGQGSVLVTARKGSFDEAAAKTVPKDLLADYRDKALITASVEELEPGEWYAELPIPDFRGVWAEGTSRADALASLARVLDGWLLLKILDKDGDIPVINGIDLNRL